MNNGVSKQDFTVVKVGKVTAGIILRRNSIIEQMRARVNDDGGDGRGS